MTNSFSDDDGLNRDILIFTKRLHILIKTIGAPIAPALQLLSKDDRIQSNALKAAIASIAEDMKNDAYLADLLAGYDNIFSPFYVAAIRVGEQTGNLDIALKDILGVQEYERQLDS